MPTTAPTAPASVQESLRIASDQWTASALTAQTLWTRFLGRTAIDAMRDARLAWLIAHARQRSPLYGELWRGLPAQPVLADLPRVTKLTLMAAFDEWCTDRSIRLRDVERFLHDGEIGGRFADRYLVWTSSGTTGVPGIFLQNDAALAAYDAQVGVQLAQQPQLHRQPAPASGQRPPHACHAALVTVDSGHFASIASWRRIARAKPWLRLESISVDLPLAQIVAALDACSPDVVAAYPTVLSLLADEQAAGRLHLQPTGLWSGGEVLTPSTRRRIERAFACPLHNEYGASECLTIGYGCREGWLHVNADWVILEPVERDGSPTPPGVLSHTVLLTNLANGLQPIIRYDLGDRMRLREDPCACGSPLPAMEIEGRSDDIVTLRAADGALRRLVPLALTTVVEEAADIHHFQIVQTAPDRLGLRIADVDRRRAGARACRALRAYLRLQGLSDVRIGLERETPAAAAGSGKLRQVIALPGFD